jgi:uncharacterized RDD family membrane protein YckC
MLDKYDTFWRRFYAGLLDGLVLLPIGILVALIQGDNVLSLVLGMIIMHSAVYVYSVYFHYYSGQTLGKKWMNLRVVDKNEQQLLTFEQSLKRDSIPIFLETIGILFISFQIIKLGYMPSRDSLITQMTDWLGVIWFILEIVTMMTNDKRRALHDLLANSVVIKNEYWTGKKDEMCHDM